MNIDLSQHTDPLNTRLIAEINLFHVPKIKQILLQPSPLSNREQFNDKDMNGVGCLKALMIQDFVQKYLGNAWNIAFTLLFTRQSKCNFCGRDFDEEQAIACEHILTDSQEVALEYEKHKNNDVITVASVRKIDLLQIAIDEIFLFSYRQIICLTCNQAIENKLDN